MANTQGIRAGRAYIELGVGDKLTAGLKRAQARLRAFGTSVTGMGVKLMAVGGAMAAPFVIAAKNFASMGDAVAKMSRRTGVGVEALSELGYAAELSGTSMESLENGLRRMQRTIYDAGRGLSTAKDALADLGLSAKDFKGLSPEDQFTVLGEALSRIEDPSRRAAIAMTILGRSGTALLPMVAKGAAGLDELRKKARDLGLSISTKDAAAITWINQNRGLIVSVAKPAVGVVAAGAALVVAGKAVTLLGILTNENPFGLAPDSPHRKVAVYVPYSYMFGGPTFFASPEHIVDVDMSVEQCMKTAATAMVGTQAILRQPKK